MPGQISPVPSYATLTPTQTNATESTTSDDASTLHNVPFRASQFELPVRQRPGSLGTVEIDVYDLPDTPPFTYPEDYTCTKCQNTGIKLKNKLSCQECYAKFAKQDRSVTVLNPPLSTRQIRDATSRREKVALGLMRIIEPLPTCPPTMVRYGGMSPIVITPGDAAIGGTLCGRCRGPGVIHADVIYEKTCPTCLGLGRLI